MRKMITNERGAGIPEYMVIIFILIILIAVVVYVVFQVKPELYNDLLNLNLDLSLPSVALILAILGALLGGIKWALNEMSDVIDAHAQQDILEFLSKGTSKSNQEINQVLGKKRMWYRLFRETLNVTLQELLEKRLVQVKNEKYSLKRN